jgi:hypothetical protein
MQLKEGIISRSADLFYAFRFLKLLTTPWDKMSAYELGVIDGTGKVLKKPSERTNEDKAAYTVFHKLVFNVKRLLGKLPFGQTKLASYAAALFLIKEHTGMSEDRIRKTIEQIFDEPIDATISENTWYESDSGLSQGVYVLRSDVVSPITGDTIAKENSKVVVETTTPPVTRFLGQNIYEVLHVKTKQKIYITNGDISR